MDSSEAQKWYFVLFRGLLAKCTYNPVHLALKTNAIYTELLGLESNIPTKRVWSYTKQGLNFPADIVDWILSISVGICVSLFFIKDLKAVWRSIPQLTSSMCLVIKILGCLFRGPIEACDSNWIKVNVDILYQSLSTNIITHLDIYLFYTYELGSKMGYNVWFYVVMINLTALYFLKADCGLHFTMLCSILISI